MVKIKIIIAVLVALVIIVSVSTADAQVQCEHNNQEQPEPQPQPKHNSISQTDLFLSLMQELDPDLHGRMQHMNAPDIQRLITGFCDQARASSSRDDVYNRIYGIADGADSLSRAEAVSIMHVSFMMSCNNEARRLGFNVAEVA